jgi:hypothetical protein
MAESFDSPDIWPPFGAFSMAVIQGPGQIAWLNMRNMAVALNQSEEVRRPRANCRTAACQVLEIDGAGNLGGEMGDMISSPIHHRHRAVHGRRRYPPRCRLIETTVNRPRRAHQRPGWRDPVERRRRLAEARTIRAAMLPVDRLLLAGARRREAVQLSTARRPGTGSSPDMVEFRCAPPVGWGPPVGRSRMRESLEAFRRSDRRLGG